MFYKTFYVANDPGSGSVAPGAFGDSKLRRETSNFKINFAMETYIPDPNSENPAEPIEGLVQILPKNLAPEDFIGMIVSADHTAPNEARTWIISTVRKFDDHVHPMLFTMNIGALEFRYFPSTGYLVDSNYSPESSGGEEGGGDA